jgi:hypothetical protein
VRLSASLRDRHTGFTPTREETMSTIVAKAAVAAAGLSLSCLALCAATLVQDVRVFDGRAVHERRSVLFDDARVVDADFRGSVPAGARIVQGPDARCCRA